MIHSILILIAFAAVVGFCIRFLPLSATRNLAAIAVGLTLVFWVVFFGCQQTFNSQLELIGLAFTLSMLSGIFVFMKNREFVSGIQTEYSFRSTLMFLAITAALQLLLGFGIIGLTVDSVYNSFAVWILITLQFFYVTANLFTVYHAKKLYRRQTRARKRCQRRS